MALLMHAASRRTTNSKPSLETSVTYLLKPWFWLEVAMVVCVAAEWLPVGGARLMDVGGKREFSKRPDFYQVVQHEHVWRNVTAAWWN
jgi:hypothetical protein